MAEDPGVVQTRPMEIQEETCSMHSQSIIASMDGGNSMTYPYRAVMKDTSFPCCHPMAKPLGTQVETFAHSLNMLGHGEPLWNPVGDLARPQEQLASGTRIGDVGFMDNEGGFSSYFNIFLPPNHPAQWRCPPDHIPLDPPHELNISTHPGHFSAGTSLMSNGIEASILSASPLDIRFTINVRDGGIFVLPDGASREDLLSTTRIRDYAQKHALKWYVFANQSWGGVVHPNGTLYVVTGTDKATRWANCVTYSKRPRFDRLWKPSVITYQGQDEDNEHCWEASTEARQDLAYKRSREDVHTGLCTLFVRGMKVAVNIREWTNNILQNELPNEIPYYFLRTVPSSGLRAAIQTVKECWPGYAQMVPPDEGHGGVRVIFHPLDVILKLLLEEAPSSTVAIVEDHIWNAVADKSDANPASFIRLLVHILETHEAVVNDGVVTLVPHKTISEKEVSAPLTRGWPRFLIYIKDVIRIKQQRRGILKRLAKVFPGPAVPAELYRPMRRNL